MKRLFYVSAIAAIAGFSACSKSDSPNNPPPAPATAKVMFSNNSIGFAAQGVKLNDTLLAGASNLDYGQQSGYISITPGSNQKIQFVLSSAPNAILDTTYANFSANNSYSVFRTGIGATPNVLVISDDLAAPNSGKAKVRFVNVSPDNIKAGFYLDNVKVDSNIMYKDYTSFAQVNTTDSVKVTMADPDNPPNNLQVKYKFAAGKIYTIILCGTSLGSGSTVLKLSEINNN